MSSQLKVAKMENVRLKSRLKELVEKVDPLLLLLGDNPKQRMERITYHGENIGALEQALQALDPDSYKEYFRTKPTYDSKILPFKELNAQGGIVGLYI